MKGGNPQSFNDQILNATIPLMPYRDLQDFLQTLDQKGLLRRVRAEVSRDLEISEITDRTVKAGGPALLFENVRGHAVPVAINLFGTRERMALALDVPSLDRLPDRLGQILALATSPPGGGFLEKIKALPRLMEAASFLPKSVDGGICKDVILMGDRVDLDRFPVLTCWPGDGGRFITFPLVFTLDPESGRRNVGTYRMQVYDRRTTGMHIHWHKDGARHLRKARAPLPAAVVVGCDPAMCFAATLPLPPDVDEVLFAGFARKRGVELVRAKTVDLEVPATAEIVLEGYVEPGERRREGPFGDHTGYYSLPDEFPVFHLTAITHRRDPIYISTIVGPPPQEDAFLGKATERIFLPLLRKQLPEIVDMNLPVESCFHNLVIVSIDKRYPGHARKVMSAFWGLGQLMFSKIILVVDRDVNVHDPREVLWKATNHIDPRRDIVFVDGPVDELDHAAPLTCFGSKMGIDATHKWASEGFTRGWPTELVMPPAVKARIDELWPALGIRLPQRPRSWWEE